MGLSLVAKPIPQEKVVVRSSRFELAPYTLLPEEVPNFVNPSPSKGRIYGREGCKI